MNVRRQHQIQRIETIQGPPVLDDAGALMLGLEQAQSKPPLVTELCCQKGLKSMSSVLLCDAPCCPGLIEQEKEAPLLGLMAWCDVQQQVRDTESESLRSEPRLRKRHVALKSSLH